MSATICLFLKAAASQADLFTTQKVPVRGSTRGGHTVRPYLATRRKKRETPAATPKSAEKQLTGDALIEAALEELKGRMQKTGVQMSGPKDVKKFIKLHLAGKRNEAFAVMYLDVRHRLIAYEEMFQGTIDGASVYPRVVAQRALEHNAAAVVLAHNHPSGTAEPSAADKSLTRRLKEALGLLDIRIIDHIIVGGSAELEAMSFAERGLM